ncbi:4Fe-4S dicluster domain-containing protein [Rhodospirillum rubrum]|uniref:4Fe-4S ferredoxin, iron-sulfur binding n=1 Tax=Rhodospirillum rubrum (strain ATCC 11170 / ATH 1.1.1 / DSM 467 / LMG 4362 / NCIMB 8255 / S1) TaxID=269796 RepID=Q2RXL7_RHORT|nr:4Fe-4S dicluster domain-containing protein [Rhodospirillum rubrum]ABC21128.1 4Fe-4S ferredoxin, iron-sulfur binding [Rhodospirillum rubrum ATCC 11170]AEO46796.1 4Fe-4S ferredoxin, iron-sulfur binding protein [Rhodospirillum rubrum F11]MBK5952675.1 4Fe-4S ferredoxin [Rhodospirillum rubrum]QXG80820.1 4Fe-4S dicluster domain-containing protein [Rhodospirillum rubrum]HAP98573.1 4Fe-4S dicluster domain-containing protein [Rhodospirillum rubrum]
MNKFVIADPKKCIGCRTCEVACVVAHSNGKGGANSMSEESFSPRLRVIKTATVTTPIQCHHCDDAPCLNACPNGAIVYSHDSVQVNQARCMGCKNCVMACPFGAMQVVKASAHGNDGDSRRVEAHKCDLCIERAAGPACIDACPTKSLHLVDRERVQEVLRKRQLQAALDASGMSL